jgi:uncharacterized membrane protein YqaE (UPF0057 family)
MDHATPSPNHATEPEAAPAAPIAAGQRLREQVGAWGTGRPMLPSGALLGDEAIRRRLLLSGEVLLIIIWAVLVGLPYLNFAPDVVPAGIEFLSAIQMHHVWEHAQECGTCAFWYGHTEGGFPSFVDPISSVLHPLVILTTLIWGTLNGAKVALVGSFAMAGVAQWWLAHVIGLGRAARLWSGLMVVVAGHLAARMDLGAFNMVLSAAACALVLPPLVALLRSGSLRNTVVLGIMLALAGVSGNGYLQVALAFCMLAVPLLLPWDRRQALQRVGRLGLALGLALLLAAPFLVPFLHFLPNMAKDYDIEFTSSQPFPFVPLNLVINDHEFYTAEVLGKIPYPSHYVMYVGWIPVLLALWGAFGARKRDDVQMVVFLAASMLLALWVASAEPLRWLISISPIEAFSAFVAGVRFTGIMAAMAVPFLLALSAIGLDRLTHLENLRARLSFGRGESSGPVLRLDLRWLLLIPCLLALSDAWLFNSRWIRSDELSDHIPIVIDALQTSDLQWVEVPLGQHFYVEPAIDAGLKLSVDFFRTWHWRGEPQPAPVLEANIHGVSEDMDERGRVEGIYINQNMDNAYAMVWHGQDEATPCRAYGTGGHIDVQCELDQGGLLIVKERNWSGWKAQLAGEALRIRNNTWLSVELPPGTHEVAFRYRPWDVWLGLFLFGVGLLLAGGLWWLGGEPARPAPPTAAADDAEAPAPALPPPE